MARCNKIYERDSVRLEFDLVDCDGAVVPIDPADTVELLVTDPNALVSVVPMAVDDAPLGKASYTAAPAFFSIIGTWQVQVRITGVGKLFHGEVHRLIVRDALD